MDTTTTATPDTGRNLVICCDGTSNEFGRKNTNVVRLVQCLVHDSDRQLIYYNPGVGTLPDPNRFTRLGKWWTTVIGLAFGYGLTADVTHAYAYLMETWQPGDRVFIFGFSRGAYTARVLAGLLHSYGLLPKGGSNLLPYVLKGYKALSARAPRGVMKSQEEVSRDFRRTFARSVPGDVSGERHFPVHFVGVWDTVSTVGWVWDPQSFRNTALNPSIRYARHIMALDERRVFFRQNRFRTDVIYAHPAGSESPAPEPPKPGEIPRLVECWFPGVHCDVGGGYEGPDDQLWPLSLEWMLSHAGELRLEIDPARKKEMLDDHDPDQTYRRRHHESLEGAWEVAEHFPTTRWRQNSQGVWERHLEFGHGTPRKVRAGEWIHRWTLERLRAAEVILPDGKAGRYEPRSLCEKYKEKVRQMPEPLPEYDIYQPQNCGCEACERL